MAAGARMVDFGGWDMPVNYGSQIEEHHAVRRDAGMFDVSHMTVVDLEGAQAREFLRKLLANDVDKLREPGKALYSCMLNEQAGIIDDLIVYFLRDDWFRMVVNAATHDKDLAWIRRAGAGFRCTAQRTGAGHDRGAGTEGAREGRAGIARRTARAATLALKPFRRSSVSGFFVARTGYTGEEGFEIMLPPGQAAAFWQALIAQGVLPCGLGARDTLRLEAAMNLYGQDMDENVTPLESGLDWTIAWEPAERDVHRPLCARSPARCRPATQIRRTVAGRQGRDARPPESDWRMAPAKARSPAVRSRPPWSVPSPWRACR